MTKNNNDHEIGMSTGYALLQLLSSPRRLMPLVLLFPLLLALIWLVFFFCLLTIRLVFPGTFQVGTVTIAPQHEPTTLTFLLSPNGGVNSPWVDTGLEVTEGTEVKITASGRINLAIHRLVEKAYTDELPPLPWNGPDGIRVGDVYPPYEPRPKESERKPYRIDPELPQGRLIGVISRETPRPKPQGGVQDIGSDKTFTAKESGHLWLTVNEIWLDENRRSAYTGESDSDWQSRIVGNRYWNVWFDDNAGAFLVNIRVKPR